MNSPSLGHQSHLCFPSLMPVTPLHIESSDSPVSCTQSLPPPMPVDHMFFTAPVPGPPLFPCYFPISFLWMYCLSFHFYASSYPWPLCSSSPMFSSSCFFTHFTYSYLPYSYCMPKQRKVINLLQCETHFLPFHLLSPSNSPLSLFLSAPLCPFHLFSLILHVYPS